MKFFDSFWKSVFYKESKDLSFWGAFWKLTVVSLFIALLYSVYFYVAIGIHIPAHLYSYGLRVVTGYPTDLEIILDNDRLTANRNGLFHLYPISEGRIDSIKIEDTLPGYVLAINADESVSLEAYDRANALVFLGKDGIITRSHKEIQMIPYKEITKGHERLAVNRPMVEDMVAVLNEYAPSVPFVMGVIIFVGLTIFLPIGYSIACLFYGFVVMLLSRRIIKRETTFKESYTYSLFALAPVILIYECITGLPYIGTYISFIPFLVTILVVLFLWVMFREVKSSPHLSVLNEAVAVKDVPVIEESGNEAKEVAISIDIKEKTASTKKKKATTVRKKKTKDANQE